MQERRKAARSRTHLGGMIGFDQRTSAMNCAVRNYSPAGAKVTFTNSASIIPDKFDLTIASKERSYRTRMVWRNINEAGVEFLSEYRKAVTVPLEWAKRLRQCEAENAALRKHIAQHSESTRA